MNKKQKNAFEIKLKKETRKEIIKTILPAYICFYVCMLLIFAIAGNGTGLGIIGWLKSMGDLSIILIVLMIAMIPFLWFMERPFANKRTFRKILKDMSKTLVEKVMVPGELIRVILIKAKGDYGDFVLELQKDEKIEIYAVLGEKDNLIATYAVLKGEEKKRNLDIVSKGEFADYYRFVDDSKNS